MTVTTEIIPTLLNVCITDFKEIKEMKMTRRKEQGRKFLIPILLIPFLSLLSCDFFNAGLGDKVDMRGPDLTITSPAYMEDVQNEFTLTGTVRDDYAIETLSLSIDRLATEWRHINGQWQTRTDSDAAWMAYADGTWAEGSDGTVNWSLDVTLDGTGSGEYLITGISIDTSGNSGSDSIVQLMVVYDDNPPNLTVLSPALEDLDATAASILFDTYNLQTIALMDKMLNGDILFRWSIADDFSVGDLHIELADAAGNKYFEEVLNDVDRNGEYTITAAEIIDPVTTLPVSDKTYLQIVTTSYDMADNFENKSNGWFCYWPAADTPWVNVSLSGDPVNPSTVYPEFLMQGQAYDDDSIQSVQLSLYAGLSASGTPMAGYPVTQVNARESRSYTWSIIPPPEANEYTLLISCTDENGITSTIENAYFEVEDISIPRIFVDSPAQDTTLFGNMTGDFTFSGICDDDSMVRSLRMYWVNPHGADPSSTQLSYMDASNSNWSSSSYPRIDANDGALYNITLDPAVVGTSGRSERSFFYTLNIFSNLGISASNTLKNQVFLLRAEDENGKVKVLPYSTSGDSQAPDITIDTVSVNGGLNQVINSDLTLPAFEAGDKVDLIGTWGDDSFDIWGDDTKIILDYFEWNGTSISSYIHLQNDGTWYSDPFTPPTGAVATLSAGLIDWGGNRGTQEESFFVESDNPQLLRISSSNSDSAYKAGETIQIQLDFNKTITFSGGSNPQLLLNTGDSADFVSGNGTTSHMFEYTVSTGDNITDLDVSSIVDNGNTWRDVSNAVTTMTMPTGVNSLAGSKNITIDTTAPTITAVSAVSSSGAYKAGDVLYMALEFSEDVLLSNATDLKLELSNGIGLKADYLNTSSPTRILFSYTVVSGDNAADLSVVSPLNLGTTVIRDIAGNNLVTAIADESMTGTHTIDTNAPAAPVISGLTAGNTYEAEQFSLTGIAAGCTAEYSVDSGTTWQEYTVPVDLNVNGSYQVTARQTDAAGNVSSEATDISLDIDIGSLLTRVSADVADGIYSQGDIINITLYFRKAITVSGTPTLTLNSSSSNVVLSSGDGTSSLVFQYTIGASDSVSSLDVSSLNMGTAHFQDSDGTVVDNWCLLSGLASGMTLAEQKSIDILNGVPQLFAIDITGDTLTLSYNRDIYKGAGSIVLAQSATGYRIPSVMSQARYDEIYDAADAAGKTALENSFTWTTNGASDTGVPDLDGKYVLNFTLDSDDATLVGHFRTAGAHIVTIPVASSNVSCSGADLAISLTGGYALPVQGASYELTIPAGLVQDVLSNNNALYSNNITFGGVEAPVIRVDRQSETLQESGGTVIADQPLTVDVKIDCETPGADIYYLYTEGTFTTEPIADPNGGPAPPTAGAAPATPAEPGTGSNAFTAAFTIGDALNHTSGYKYLIRSRATNGSVWSDSSYEAAYRSVLIFDNDAGTPIADANHNYSTGVEQVWVRGGDSVSGATLTPGFPLSWDQNQYDMIRLMTDDGTGNWYWVSWELNSAAFVGLLLGTTPATLADAVNGPLYWGWGKNAWTGSKAYFPVFPGESRTLESGLYATIDGQPRGAYEFARSDRDVIHNR